jgi:hypothetical protein
MKTRIKSKGVACTAVALLVFFIFGVRAAFSGDSATSLAQAASPELIGQLTKSLSITPTQAGGGAGALFGLAKSRLSPADFGKVAASVPGMDSLIQSAPAASGGAGIPGVSGISGITGALPGKLGGLASVAGSFQKLGLSPGMAGKFVPVLTSFVKAKGGSSVSSLLSGALK